MLAVPTPSRAPGSAMKPSTIDLSYLWLLLGMGAAFGPPMACVDVAKSEARQAERLRRHKKTSDPAQRELIVDGKAHAAGGPLTSPQGASCLAWRHAIIADRREGSGSKTRTVRKEICNKSEQTDLRIEAPDGVTFEALAPRPTHPGGLAVSQTMHPREGAISDSKLTCPQLTKSDLKNATFVEHCLQEGDTVQAWGCREPGTNRLVFCRDQGDFIAAPPGRDPIKERSKDAATTVCMGAVWLMIGGGLLLAFLSDKVALTSRAAKKLGA